MNRTIPAILTTLPREMKVLRAGLKVLGRRIAVLVILLSMTRSGVAAPPDDRPIADCSFLCRALKNDTNGAVHCSASGWKRPPRYSDEGSLSLYLYVGPPLGRRLYVNRQRDGDLVFLRAGREPGWPACEYPHFRVFERGGLSAWVFPFKKADDPAWQKAAAELDRTFADHPEWVNRVEGLLPPDTPPRTERLADQMLAFQTVRTDNAVRLESLLGTGGVRPDLEMGTSVSLLHRAAVANATNCVALLLERGADPLRLDRFGRTPREEALHHGALDAAALLPERPATSEEPEPSEGISGVCPCQPTRCFFIIDD